MQVMRGKNETLKASRQIFPYTYHRSDLQTPFGDRNAHIALAQ